MAADPYLAITLDAKRRIVRTARALELDPARMGWGLLDLLEHVWERKDPAVSALVVAACFGPDPRIPAALVEFGFLVSVGAAWELCKEETDRLLLTHKQRVAAGRARAASADRSAGGTLQRSPSGTPADNQRTTSSQPALTPSTQHPAPSTQEEDLPRAAPADPPPLVLQEQRQKRTRKPSRQEVLYTALVAHRAEVLGPESLPDEPWTVARQNEALGGPILGCAPDLLLAALQRFLGSEFAGRCNPPGPLGVFVKQWSRWVSVVMNERTGTGEK